MGQFKLIHFKVFYSQSDGVRCRVWTLIICSRIQHYLSRLCARDLQNLSHLIPTVTVGCKYYEPHVISKEPK